MDLQDSYVGALELLWYDTVGTGFLAMNWDSRRFQRRLSRPSTWPVGARRLFVAGLPLALPLWLIAFAAATANETMKSLVRPLKSYWSDPPKSFRSANYNYNYSHYSERSRRSKVLRLEDARDRRDAA